MPEIIIPTYRRLITGLNQDAPGTRIRRPDGSGDDLIILTLAGSGSFQGNGQKDLLLPGSITWIPNGTPHDYGPSDTDDGWSLIWTHFRPWPHWKELLHWPRRPTGARMIELDDPVLIQTVEKDLRRMHAHATSARPHREICAMNALEKALLGCDQANPRQAVNQIDPRIQGVIDFLHAHLAEPLTVGDLARVASLSPSRFAHLFTGWVGMPPLQYLETQRLGRARDLLAYTTQPIAELAEEVGFPNSYYFSRRFRKFSGLSPRSYRHQVSGEPRENP